MADCKGTHPVTAKVDGEMRDTLDEDAEHLGVYRAEVVRESLDLYVALRQADFQCPSCGEPIKIEA